MNGRFRSPLRERAQQIKQAREALAAMFTDGRIVTGSTLIDQPTEIVGTKSIGVGGRGKSLGGFMGNRFGRLKNARVAPIQGNSPQPRHGGSAR